MKALVYANLKSLDPPRFLFIILGFLLGVALASPKASTEIIDHPEAVDYPDYLKCVGKVPLRGWLSTGLRSRYADMDQLCKKTSELPNFGCRCASRDGVPECWEHDGDHQLWSLPGVLLLSRCFMQCFCQGNPYTLTDGEEADEDGGRLIRHTRPTSDKSGPSSSKTFTATISKAQFGSQKTAPTCKRACTSSFGCGGEDANCKCRVRTASAGLWRLDGCENTFGTRKREDSESIFACPCNETYVSEACCNVKNGLVWENPGFNLGKLVFE